MKRCLALLLAIVTILLPCGITVNAEGELSENSKNMITFIKEKNNNLLVSRNNYAYMKLGAKWYSDVGVNYCLQMADLLIDTGSCPDKEKYMEVLINIIATYDMDNAADLSSQKKQDNLKSLKDYGMDAVKLATDAVSVYSGLDGIKGELSNAQDALSKAIDGVSVLIDNTNNWIDALTDLETFTQDYSNYNSFLKCIEDNADGDLKEAAATLRNSMKQAFLLKLEAYGNVTSENFKNYTQFFFDDIFFDAVKSFDEYQTDETFSFFVNSAEGLYERINILEDSWELGKDIGKLIGNITVGGENLINRTLEIEALYDISVILQTKVLDSTTEFLSHSADSDADEYIDEYVTFANFLIGCRIRGEYCTYTILAEDSGLLSLLSDKTDAQNWYDDQSSAIIRLKNRINNIKTANTTNEYTAEELINKPAKEILEMMNGKFEIGHGYVDGIYTFYNYDVFPGMDFYTNASYNEDETVVRNGIATGYIDITHIQVNDGGMAFRVGDKTITADMNFNDCISIIGEHDGHISKGQATGGAPGGIGIYYDKDDSMKIEINLDNYGSLLSSALENNAEAIAYSSITAVNPKIKNIVITNNTPTHFNLQASKFQYYNGKIYYPSVFTYSGGGGGYFDLSEISDDYVPLPLLSSSDSPAITTDDFIIDEKGTLYFINEFAGTGWYPHDGSSDVLYKCNLDGSGLAKIAGDVTAFKYVYEKIVFNCVTDDNGDSIKTYIYDPETDNISESSSTESIYCPQIDSGIYLGEYKYCNERGTVSGAEDDKGRYYTDIFYRINYKNNEKIKIGVGFSVSR